MEIETRLDDDGRGVLSEDMFDFFVVMGCIPACHICHKSLEPGGQFRLKEYVKPSRRTRKDGTEVSAKVMICDVCDISNKRLPENQTGILLREGMEKDDLDYRLIMSSARIRRRYFKETGRHMGCFVIDGRIVTSQEPPATDG